MAWGSYEAYFAELESQYAVEHSETAFLIQLFGNFTPSEKVKRGLVLFWNLIRHKIGWVWRLSFGLAGFLGWVIVFARNACGEA
ncbi:hypothetical protein EP57_10740 [Listeria booriae]|uniref:Uncharacterized protein n=1 Tax=Listeria booriae TaxID=1552123 RepID=A0A099W6E9_9LIST|nr:hypothetical protein EP57_10740 [Listeria booriae]